jgi:hypothetical protein
VSGLEADYRRMLVYRLVYGACRERLEAFYAEEPAEAVLADPLRGVRLEPEALADPEVKQLVRRAAADAVDGRRPRW